MAKRFMFYSAISDIVLIFGETELGSCELDEEAIAQYVLSDKFISHLWGCSTKEDIYEKITDDIVNGFPVWEFLKISDWTKERLEKAYASEQTKKWIDLCKRYKCYSCEYYKSKQTALGIFEKCEKPTENNTFNNKNKDWKLKRESFKPKKKCKDFKRI